MQNASPKAISMKMSPVKVLNSPRLWSTHTVGTTAGGMMSPHQEVDHAAPAALSALRHIGHHRGQHDQDGDADHGQDDAVDEGDDQHVVAGGQRVPKFWSRAQVVGSENWSSPASVWVLAAVNKMKAKGTKKTTPNSAIASRPSQRCRLVLIS